MTVVGIRNNRVAARGLRVVNAVKVVDVGNTPHFTAFYFRHFLHYCYQPHAATVEPLNRINYARSRIHRALAGIRHL